MLKLRLLWISATISARISSALVKGRQDMIFRLPLVLYVIVFCAGVMITLHFQTIGIASEQWSVLIFALLGLLSFAFVHIEQRMINKRLAIMVEKCQIREFISIWSKLLKRAKFFGMKQRFLLDHSTAYLSIKESSLAKQILDEVTHFSNNKMGAINKVLYYNNLTSYYFQIDDIENALIANEKLKLALQNKKIVNEVRAGFLRNYEQCFVVSKMSKGNYDGAEDFFKEQFTYRNNLLGKVNAMHHLANIYLFEKDITKAKEALSYVCENGGDTYYAQEAKVNLIELNNIL